jgi:hypothetical protein
LNDEIKKKLEKEKKILESPELTYQTRGLNHEYEIIL